MKIKRSEMKKYIKLLSSLKYRPLNEKSTLFFEIDVDKTVEESGFVLDTKTENKGAATLVRPGLMLTCDNSGKKPTTKISLAYAQIDYSPKFNLDSYLEILEIKLPTKDKIALVSLDAYLVDFKYILGEFEL